MLRITMIITLVILAKILFSQDNALSFDGANDYVEIPDNNLLDFGNNDFTIEIWVRKNEATVFFNDTYIVSKWVGATAGDEWTLTAAAGQNDDLPRFIIDDSGTRYTVISSTPLTIGQWHHLSAVRDGDFLRIYLDGSLKGTTYCGSATVNNAGTHLRIGVNSPGSPFGDYYSNIDVDELRIWNYARSAVQISTGLNGLVSPNTNGLTAYYRFNQGIAGGNNTGETTLSDGTTNTLDGTLYDFALSGSSSNWIGSSVALPVCPIGDITFSSQAQIDDFPIDYPGCTEITGNVIIGVVAGPASNITNLNGLSGITSITGRLHIGGNPALLSLSGLENLQSIGGGMIIISNDALTSLEYLADLTTIGGSFEIVSNSSLTSLSGLENLQSIGGQLWIGSNPNLLSLNGLSGLTELPNGLVINANGTLPNLNGLENITSAGWLVISQNSALTSLNGINNLTSIEYGLYIQSNFILASLNGLNSLTSIGTDCFISISAITNLSGLASLSSIGGTLSISDNYALTTLAGAPNLAHLGGTLFVDANFSLLNLNGLENLTAIPGALYLSRNNALASLSGLENLSSIGRLEFTNNPSLASLSALSNLTTINGDWLSIIGPTALTNLNGLENVSGFTNLYISSNPLLSDCAIAPVCDKLSNPNGSIVSINSNAPCSACFNQIAVVADCNNSPYEWVSCPATQTLVLDENCSVTLPNYTTLAATANNCQVLNVTQSPAVGATVSGAGDMIVTLTVEYVNYPTTSCTFTVSKVDQIPPSITCPAAQTLVLGANCTAALPDYTNLATTSDNCGVQSVTQSPAIGATVSGAGSMTVTLTVTDINGLTNSCDFTVNKVDQTPPSITCPAAQTLVLGANCTAALPDYTGFATTSDNCGVQSVTQSPAIGATVSGAGTMTITLTVTDINGLTNSCDFTVNKVDQTPPSITCPAAQTLVLGASCTAALPDFTTLATTSDNCGVQSVTQSPAIGATVAGAGSMTVTLTVTDINGLTNNCTFTVNKVDQTPPSTTCPAAQTLVLGANCTASLPDYTALATTSDNCGVQSVTQSPAIGATVSGAGTMTVTLTVTDINGLTNSCDFTVNKVDQTPPSITCPAAQTLVLGASCTAALPDYTNLATTSDNCGVQSVTQSPAIGATVSGAGSVTVTLTVTDINGLTNSCDFTVNKVDQTPPSITCPAAQTLVLGASCTASLPDYTALATTSDNCGVQSVTQSPAIGATVSGAGNMTVTLTVTDINGLTNSCDFTVNKVDQTPPSITCPAAQTLVLGASCTAALPDYTNLATTSDNCGVQSVTQSPAIGATVAGAGSMTVTLTVTDINGLTNSCDFTVNKVDQTPPSITCPAAQTLVLGASCTAALPDFTTLATTSDNCGVQSVTQSPAIGSTVSGAGSMTVTLTVTDINGLTNSCDFTVNKVDQTPPSITCPAAQTLVLGASCTAVLPDFTTLATTSDNCGVQSVTQSPAIGATVSGAGSMIVTLTVTDINGLTNSCDFTVNKVDQTPPSITCPAAQTLVLGASCTAALPDFTTLATTSDNCGVQSVTQSPAIGSTVSGAGTMTVTLTVTDINGLTNSCDFTVNKVDQAPPSITCPAAQTLVLGANDMAALPDYTGLAVAADNCGIQSVTQSPTSGTIVSDEGNLTVTLTVTDVNGLTNTCQFTVQKTQETALSITCPTVQTLVLGTNCSAALPDYTSLATVVSSVGIQSLNQSPAVGTIVSGTGLIEVTLTATNLNGQSAQCTFTITKTDVTPPTVQCLQPAVTFNGEASLALSAAQLAVVSDNCGVQSVQFSSTHIDVIQLGQTVPVTVTATDINGNAATCTAQVNVGGLPAGWSENPTGIGCAGPCNNFEYNPASGVWTGTSTGAFYGPPYNADVTAFTQRTLCGNGSITAQVTGISGTALGWAGVVMRESNAPGAKKAQLMTNLSNLSRREFRTATNDQSIQQQFPSQNRYWLRITRAGNQFNMFVSSNGISWFPAGTQNIVMDNCIQMGLVATNYTANSTVTATFAGLSFTDSNPISGTNINEVAESIEAPYSFEVYPNPTNGELNIDLTQYIGRSVRMEMYSMEGKLLKVIEIEEVNTVAEQLNLSAFPGGMYLMKVKSAGLPDATRRVVLNR